MISVALSVTFDLLKLWLLATHFEDNTLTNRAPLPHEAAKYGAEKGALSVDCASFMSVPQIVRSTLFCCPLIATVMSR